MSKTATIGRGIIRISHAALFHIEGGEIEASDTQGQMEDRGIFEKVHKHLLLPPGYKIIGMWTLPRSGRYWEILVESTDISPPIHELEPYPIVTPTYVRDANGPRLVGIAIEGASPITSTTQILSTERLGRGEA